MTTPNYSTVEQVFDFMADGRWHALTEVASKTGLPVQSVSARLRDLRKPRFGRFTVDRMKMWGKPTVYVYKVGL